MPKGICDPCEHVAGKMLLMVRVPKTARLYTGRPVYRLGRVVALCRGRCERSRHGAGRQGEAVASRLAAVGLLATSAASGVDVTAAFEAAQTRSGVGLGSRADLGAASRLVLSEYQTHLPRRSPWTTPAAERTFRRWLTVGWLLPSGLTKAQTHTHRPVPRPGCSALAAGPGRTTPRTLSQVRQRPAP